MSRSAFNFSWYLTVSFLAFIEILDCNFFQLFFWIFEFSFCKFSERYCFYIFNSLSTSSSYTIRVIWKNICGLLFVTTKITGQISNSVGNFNKGYASGNNLFSSRCSLPFHFVTVFFRNLSANLFRGFWQGLTKTTRIRVLTKLKLNRSARKAPSI